MTHLRELDLQDEVVPLSGRGARRYIVRRGRITALPRSPLGFFTSSFLSPAAKLRMLAEPFVGRSSDPDPSLGDFVAHRLGGAVRDGPLDAFVGGVWAGDPQRVSARAVAADLIEGVASHGSLTRHALARRRERSRESAGVAGRPTSTSTFALAGGLDAWPRRLAERVGQEHVRTGARVESLERHADSWTVTWSDAGTTRRTEAGAVAMTAGPAATLALCEPWIEDVAPLLGRVRSASMAVVHLGYTATSRERLPEGFGVLVPRNERRVSLGILFTSTLLPDRAPDGFLTTTTFFGGIRSPETVSLPDDELAEHAHGDHRDLLGWRSAPVCRHVYRWPDAIPQYESEAAALRETLERYSEKRTGLHLAGRYAGGVSVPDCWRRGRRVAQTILERRGERTPVLSGDAS